MVSIAQVGDVRVRLTGDASSLNRALRTASTRLRSFGKSVTNAGSTLSTRLTLPLTILGGVAIRNFANFDFQMRRVAAVTGSTGEAFKKMTAVAKELGIKTQFTATQAAQAMGFLSIAGFNAQETLGALPGVLQLAAAGAVDLGSAADISAKVLRGFGLAVDQSGRINDVFIKTITSTNTTLISLGESFKLAGPIAKQAGLQFEETAAAIGLMGDAGFQGSLAGTSLRNSIVRLLSPSAKAKKILNQMGIEIADANGKILPMADIVAQLEKGLKTLGGQTAQTSALMEIFGVRGGPAMAALIARGSVALRKLTKDLEESGGTAKRISELQMAGLRGRLLELTSAIEGAGLAFVETLLPGITKVTQAITKIGRGFAALDKSTQKIIAGIVVLAAALGPLLLAIGLIIKSAGVLLAVFGSLGFLLTPTGLILTGLALLAVAIAKVSGLFDKAKDSARAAGAALKDYTKGNLKAALGEITAELVKTNLELIKQREAILNPMIPLADAERQKAEEVARLEKKINDLLIERQKIRNEASRRFAARPLEEITIKPFPTGLPGKPAAPVIDPAILEITKALEERFKVITRLGDVLGTSFDINAEKIAEYRTAIEELAEIGTPAAIEKMKDLAVKMKDLEMAAGTAAEGLKNIFTDIKDTITTSIDGIIRGTTSLSDAFKNLAQNFILKLQSRVLNSLLDKLGKKLAGIASGLGGKKGGGGFLGFIGSLFAKSGGVVGQTKFPTKLVPAHAFAKAPRMQFGGIAGLGPNEFPAILHRGEQVIPAGKVEQQTGPMTINVNIATPDVGAFQRSEGQITAQIARTISRARRNL